MCTGWPQAVASRRKAHLAAAGSWRAPKAVPGSSHGGQMATYASAATAWVRESCWVGVNTVEGSGIDRGDDSHSGRDGGKFASTCFRGFWWGSEPQMLFVQQPERRSDGCKAMEAEARGNGMMSHCRLPRHLNYSAAWPLVPPGCENSNFVVSELAVSKL